MEPYRVLGYSEKSDQAEIAQINRSLRNFLLRQEKLPENVVNENTSLARSLAEEFCAAKFGEKTNAETFWPPRTASGRQRPIWPRDENDIMTLIIRLIFRQIHAGLRNGQAKSNANVQQSIEKEDTDLSSVEPELNKTEYTPRGPRGPRSPPLRSGAPSEPPAKERDPVLLGNAAVDATEQQCIRYILDIGPPLRGIYQSFPISIGWLEDDTREWPLEKRNMVIRYMHKQDLYITLKESLVPEKAFPITEMIIKDTALASCNGRQRQKIRARIDNLLSTETLFCMECGYIELRGRNLMKTQVFLATWSKFSQMNSYASLDVCGSTQNIPTREVIDISSDEDSDASPKKTRAKRAKTPDFLKYERFSEQAEMQGGVVGVQTRQHTLSSYNNKIAQHVPGTGCQSRGTRPSLVVKLKCSLLNQLQTGCKTVSATTSKRRGGARIGGNSSLHNHRITEVKAIQATVKTLHPSPCLTPQSSLSSASPCVESQAEASVRSYNPTTIPTLISPSPTNYVSNTTNPEIRLSILQYQDGVPYLMDAIPIQNLSGIQFSSCTIHEFFAWYHRTTNMPGGLSSLQALTFQYPWNLVIRRPPRRIEAGNNGEFVDLREDLNEAVAQTRKANEMGLLTKQLAAVAGIFKIKVMETYISSMDGDVTSVLR